MKNISMRPTTVNDVAELSTTMRQDDRSEVFSSTGSHPMEVLTESVAMSVECFTVTIDNMVMCIWGVVELEGPALSERAGVAWMLTSELVELYPKTFWHACCAMMPEIMKRWDVLTNYIACGHEKAIRWAERLGFELAPPEPFGRFGAPFRRFTVTKEAFDV